ncbi:MAG: hypothetical protein AMJ94_05130 [Deltaproteobacteria bacterium SM23_61]|nr:MAG: hypothetical protein AMJ94_05130 [Deltaproteobacteria bacterium SM23_61]
MNFLFFSYPEKALRSLRTLRLIFFQPRGRRDFYNFLSKNKTLPSICKAGLGNFFHQLLRD